ncbi:MFS transporter [Actinoplanes sp. CA-131856]
MTAAVLDRQRTSVNKTVPVFLAVAAVSYSLVQSVVNPALEALREYVHTDRLGVSWVLTAFLLSSAVLTPVLGRLGDHLGKRRMLVAVMALLAGGSVLAALAHSLPLLIAGRVLQGAGGAVLPLAFGIVRDLLPRERVGSVVGTIAAITSVGGAAGVLVTGPIIDHLGIPWLFWLPAVANAIVAALLLVNVPSHVPHSGGSVDWLAAFLLSASLVLLLLPLSLGSQWGWGSPRTVGSLVLSAAAAALWVFVELRSRSPLIDMTVFRLRPVWTANVVSLLFGVTLYSTFGFIPTFLQLPSANGYGLAESVTASGLLFLPVTLTQLVTGTIAGPLARHVSPKVLLVLGGVPVVLCFVLLAVAHSAAWQIVLATAIGGLGFGLSLSALSAIVVHAVPASHTGAATGMNANIRNLGGAVGAAAVSSILTATAGERGWVIAFAALAVTAALGVLASLLIPSEAPPQTSGFGEKTRSEGVTQQSLRSE